MQGFKRLINSLIQHLATMTGEHHDGSGNMRMTDKAVDAEEQIFTLCLEIEITRDTHYLSHLHGTVESQSVWRLTPID